MTGTESLYLDVGGHSVAAIFHPAQGSGRGTSVLICPPWGWDEVASYRTRRAWAEQLAAAGFPTLRFDLPATGDSSGSPSDPDLLDAWVEAIGRLAAWFETPSVAALGLGIGGLLARESIARGASIDQLVLWGAPAKGKAWIREVRAFSRLQPWSDGDRLPEGAIEAGGFVLSPATRSSITELDPGTDATGLRRALLLERDGVAVDAELLAGYEGAGAEVTAAAGEGWAEMVSHPERTRLPRSVVATVEDWLGQGAGAVPAETGAFAAAVPSRELSLQRGERELVETAWAHRLGFGEVRGVLTRPRGSDSGSDACAVFFNAGAIRHIGPNRLWVEAAREIAASGCSALRVDLEAIGESDGDQERLRDDNRFFDARYPTQARAVLEALSDAEVGRRFLLTGLCAGAFWSFDAAVANSRARSLVLLNSGALKGSSEVMTDRELRALSRFLEPAWWRALFAGEHRVSGAGVVVRLLYRKAAGLCRKLVSVLRRQREPAATVDAALDELRSLETRVTLAFSAGEALQAELESEGLLARLPGWPNVALVELPGGDHSLRPLVAQAATRELLEREALRLATEGRSGTRPSSHVAAR